MVEVSTEGIQQHYGLTVSHTLNRYCQRPHWEPVGLFISTMEPVGVNEVCYVAGRTHLVVMGGGSEGRSHLVVRGGGKGGQGPPR